VIPATGRVPGRLSDRLAAAGAYAAVVPLTWLVAFRWPFGHRVDSELLRALTWPPLDLLDPLRLPVTTIVDRLPYVLLSVALVAIAVRRGRRSQAAGAGAMLVCAPLVSEALAHVVREQREAAWLASDQIAAGSWPSGHATGGLALVIAAAMVTGPRPPRWATRAALVWLVMLIYSILSLQWHYPSDVLAGFLVAAACGRAAWVATASLEGAPKACVDVAASTTIGPRSAPTGKQGGRTVGRQAQDG
jgi:membrane-associated phospholipid phosphatase